MQSDGTTVVTIIASNEGRDVVYIGGGIWARNGVAPAI